MFDKLSFSQFVKKDILMSNRNETETSLLLKAFLRMSSTFELDQILIRIPNNDLTPALKKLIEKEYSISLKETLFKRYSVLISENKKFIKEVKDYIDIPLMNNNAEYSSYIAGLFLAKGSINSPTTSSYNFEIRAKEITKALDVRELFEAMGIVVKIRQKNNWYHIYVKKAEVVADVVKVLGAPNAVVMFEDARIERHMSSSITKQLAIEEYNRGKTITASKKQIAAIKLLKKNKQYTSMPKNLRNISILRLQHPERSLMDLIVYYAQKHGVEPSKSSVNHWFREIIRRSKSQ